VTKEILHLKEWIKAELRAEPGGAMTHNLLLKEKHSADRRAAGEPGRLLPSGFFVLRTPLLPFDVLQDWSRDAGGSVTELRSRLWSLWRQPAVREAVFLASPELDAALRRADAGAAEVSDSANEAHHRALRSFVAYFSRMCARATPFGLFAGCSVGTLRTGSSQLSLPPRRDYQRHTRLDMDYLSALVLALESDSEVRNTLRYTPNSSLYPAGGRLHYVESRLGAHGRSFHLVAVDETPELTRTLANAADGLTLDELARALVTDSVSFAEAHEFMDELATSQVLVSELALDVTGAEPIHGTIARLAAHEPTQPAATRLSQARDALADIDRRGPGGNTNERYTAIQSTLAELPATPELARLFQVDLVKPAPALSLSLMVVAEVSRGLALLRRLAPPRQAQTALDTFRESFVDRYEGAEVPLVEALDEELGIGFAASDEPGGEPLLQNLDVPARALEPAPWYPHHAVLLRLVSDALTKTCRRWCCNRPTWRRSLLPTPRQRPCRRHSTLWRVWPRIPLPRSIAVSSASGCSLPAVRPAHDSWAVSAMPIRIFTAASRSTCVRRRRSNRMPYLPRSSTCRKDASAIFSAALCCASTRSRSLAAPARSPIGRFLLQICGCRYTEAGSSSGRRDWIAKSSHG
jgi:hypothetical protein